MKNRLKKLLITLIVAALCAFAAAACTPKENKPDPTPPNRTEQPDDNRNENDATEYEITVKGGTGGGKYADGASCTVKAETPSGETFAVWIADGKVVSTEAEYTFSVSKNTELIALVDAANDKYFPSKWVADGSVLDLKKGTIYSRHGFYVLGRYGRGADAVVYCREGDKNYELEINASGKAELKFNGDVETVFTVGIDAYSGLWKTEDIGGTAYTFVDGTMGADGYFRIIADYDYETGEYDGNFAFAAESFVRFDSSGEYEILLYNVDIEMTYELTNSGNLYFADAELEYFAADECFSDSYITADGGSITVYGDGTMEADGERVNCTASGGRFGAGIYYVSKGYEFALVYTADGAVRNSADGSAVLARYNPAWKNAEWVGPHAVKFNGNEIIYDGEKYALTPVSGNAFTFNDGTEEHKLELIAGSDVAVKADGEVYALQSAANMFAGNYYSGANPAGVRITADGALSVTVGTKVDAEFLVSEGLKERTATEPSGLKGLKSLAISLGNGRYFMYAGVGALAEISMDGGKIAVQSACMKEGTLTVFASAFNVGLTSADDFYTTGGVSRQTLKADFTNKTVDYCGASYTLEPWHHIYRNGDECSAVSFIKDGKRVVAYPYYDEHYIRVENSGKTATMASNVEYGKISDTAYYAAGEFVNRGIAFEADGTLVLTEPNYSAEGGDSTVQRFAEYVLSTDRGTFVVTYTDSSSGIMTFETPIYIEEAGVRVNMSRVDYYAEIPPRTADYSAFVGEYSVMGGSAQFALVIGAITRSVNSPFEYYAVVGNELADSVVKGVSSDGKPTLVISAGDTELTLTLDGNLIRMTDNGGTVYSALDTLGEWDLKCFAFDTPAAITSEDGEDYTLTCVKKADGQMPLFFLDGDVISGMRLTNYSVLRGADGVMVLDVSSTLGTSIRITVGSDGRLSFTLTPVSD